MIELKDIAFSYNNEPFLNVNTAFENGRLTVIIGENGSGKTTLLKLINGTERLKSGQVLIDGCDVAKASGVDIAKRLSCFPQSRPIPDMSVFDTVLLGRYPYNPMGFSVTTEDEDAVGRAMTEAGVWQFCHRNMKTLSYGERQRVYLAMLIAQDTENLILDEPVSFMDVSATFGLMDTLRRLCDGGRCGVCVLHDIPIAMRYADRIVIMKNGVIYDDGTPDDIFARGSIDTAFGIHLEKYESNGKAVYLPLP